MQQAVALYEDDPVINELEGVKPFKACIEAKSAAAHMLLKSRKIKPWIGFKLSISPLLISLAIWNISLARALLKSEQYLKHLKRTY